MVAMGFICTARVAGFVMRMLRENRDINTRDLATQLGVSHSTLAKKEVGIKAKFSAREVEILLKYMDISLKEFRAACRATIDQGLPADLPEEMDGDEGPPRGDGVLWFNIPSDGDDDGPHENGTDDVLGISGARCGTARDRGRRRMAGPRQVA